MKCGLIKSIIVAFLIILRCEQNEPCFSTESLNRSEWEVIGKMFINDSCKSTFYDMQIWNDRKEWTCFLLQHYVGLEKVLRSDRNSKQSWNESELQIDQTERNLSKMFWFPFCFDAFFCMQLSNEKERNCFPLTSHS